MNVAGTSASRFRWVIVASSAGAAIRTMIARATPIETTAWTRSRRDSRCARDVVGRELVGERCGHRCVGGRALPDVVPGRLDGPDQVRARGDVGQVVDRRQLGGEVDGRGLRRRVSCAGIARSG